MDVWACGVTLYVMLAGFYPFGDQGNTRTLIQNIASVNYAQLPATISDSCRDLLRRIFTARPSERITVRGIMEHPWYGVALPPYIAAQLAAPPGAGEAEPPGMQSVEELEALCRELNCQPGDLLQYEGAQEDLLPPQAP